ncbi:MAG: glycosyltransferase [Anaerolineae bacterium]|nr:glycosyltransferase [Anaerolineae bacterium]
MKNNNYLDPAQRQYQSARLAHWDRMAKKRDRWRGMGGWYHQRLEKIYRFLISPGQRVLEIGSSFGDLLAAVQPESGLGLDFSVEMIARAKQRYPEIEFVKTDAHNLSAIKGPFDTIILSDLVNELWDVQQVLEQLKALCAPRTRIILNFYSRLWEIPLYITRLLNLATPTLAQNWLTRQDVTNMLNLAGFETIRSWQDVLWPLPLGDFFNKFLVRLWPFRELALANFLVARPFPEETMKNPAVSVVIPARNETGNIKAIFDRVPKMGRETELVFIEGHSQDDTFDTIKKEIAAHPTTRSLLLRQAGIGKGDAVRLGFEHANGDILMILDADLTVPPEDLPRFYNALVSGKGEFINGVRLVYPMEDQAMRSLNLLGNKFFSLAFSWLLGQPIKDTLCGTKVMWNTDYDLIAANRAYFGDFDPFGDFDLIFGAAKLNLKIVDLPIRYRERTYGNTNISRWKHGLLLFRMVAFAARRIKFV